MNMKCGLVEISLRPEKDVGLDKWDHECVNVIDQDYNSKESIVQRTIV